MISVDLEAGLEEVLTLDAEVGQLGGRSHGDDGVERNLPDGCDLEGGLSKWPWM